MVPGAALAGSVAPMVVAPFGDGVFRFETITTALLVLMNVCQLLEKRALAVNGVKSFGFFSVRRTSLDRDDMKFRRVNTAEYFRR